METYTSRIATLHAFWKKERMGAFFKFVHDLYSCSSAFSPEESASNVLDVLFAPEEGRQLLLAKVKMPVGRIGIFSYLHLGDILENRKSKPRQTQDLPRILPIHLWNQLHAKKHLSIDSPPTLCPPCQYSCPKMSWRPSMLVPFSQIWNHLSIACNDEVIAVGNFIYIDVAVGNILGKS